MRISDWSADVCSADLVAGDRRAVHGPAHRRVEGRRAMHGAAVVPEDEVARTPLVGIDDVGTGRILAELLQECRALLRRQSLDADREAGAHIEDRQSTRMNSSP